MTEREKTLKEKVAEARKVIKLISPHTGKLWTGILREALTALENKVKELEKERTLVEKWADGYFRRIGYREFIATLKEQEAPTMAENKTDLVKEIEEIEEYFSKRCEYENGVIERFGDVNSSLKSESQIHVITFESYLRTLQRAREALQWIPVEERLPETSGNYRTTESIQPTGAEGFLYLLNFSYFDKKTKQWKGRGKIVAWMEHPAPYTPEETEK